MKKTIIALLFIVLTIIVTFIIYYNNVIYTTSILWKVQNVNLLPVQIICTGIQTVFKEESKMLNVTESERQEFQ